MCLLYLQQKICRKSFPLLQIHYSRPYSLGINCHSFLLSIETKFCSFEYVLLCHRRFRTIDAIFDQGTEEREADLPG